MEGGGGGSSGGGTGEAFTTQQIADVRFFFFLRFVEREPFPARL
jgi:hypothetical protein